MGSEKQVLPAVNLVKEKRCGKIKWRICANGAPHKNRATGGSQVTNIIVKSVNHYISNWCMGKEICLNIWCHWCLFACRLTKAQICTAKTSGEFCGYHVRRESGISALLWCECYVTVLVDLGFTINPFTRVLPTKLSMEVNAQTLGMWTTTNCHSKIRM